MKVLILICLFNLAGVTLADDKPPVTIPPIIEDDNHKVKTLKSALSNGDMIDCRNSLKFFSPNENYYMMVNNRLSDCQRQDQYDCYCSEEVTPQPSVKSLVASNTSITSIDK